MSRMSSATLFTGMTLVLCCAAQGEEEASFLRTGYFREITDGAAQGYVVNHLRMSADGTKTAFLTGAAPWADDTLRIVNTDGSGESVIFSDAEDEDHGITTAFDISDDGALAAFIVWVSGTSWDGKIGLYDTATGLTSILLTQLPHTAWGETNIIPINPQAAFASMKLSGDGASLFFLNRYGPQGSNNDGIPASGFTVYRVSIPGGAATPVFSQADIASLPGVDATTVSLMSAAGVLATNTSGSVLLLPIGGSDASGVLPHYLLHIDPAQGASSAQIILDLRNTEFYGPSLNGAGDKMVFCRFGGEAPEPAGLQIMNADGAGGSLLLDPGSPGIGRYPIFPVLSKDGAHTAHTFDTGGSTPSIRTAPTDGSGPIPVSLITIDTQGAFPAISQDGQRIALIGGVRSNNDPQHKNLVIFDWDSSKAAPANTPAVTSVTADPEFTLIRQPGLSSELSTTFSYTTFASGATLGQMFSFPYDDTAAERRATGIAGMGTYFEALVDDGLNGDEAAGDGIFDDAGIWAYSDMEKDLVTGRGAVTADNGTASFVDFAMPIRAPIAPTASFSVSPSSGVAPLEITLVNTSTGDYADESWDTDGDTFYDRFNPEPPFTLTFPAPGSYTIALKVSGFGHEDEITWTNAITVGETQEGEGGGGGESTHSGDPNGDGVVDLSETLRVIQFFNSDGLSCAGGTEDGYAPGSGDTACTPHAADYNPRDWRIGLFEILRLLQFYNSGGYYACPDADPATEDGFCVGIT